MQRPPEFEPLSEVMGRFGFKPEALEVMPWGDGHIHRTFKVSCGAPGRRSTLLMQALNREVFPEPEALMGNLLAVTEFARAKLGERGIPDPERRMQRVLLTPSGECLVSQSGALWRGFGFIEGSRTPQAIEAAAEAFEVASAFGEFIELLSDFEVAKLHPSLPDFHHTPARLRQLRSAAQADPLGRRLGVQPELEFIEVREALMGLVVQGLEAGALPLRVTHNDTKVNNVLLDAKSGRRLCVVDLDTVMAGSSLYDFGDMARTCLSPTAEDTLELHRIHAREEILAALGQGFAKGLGACLSAAERELFFDSIRLITLEQGMRFLSDHLLGDSYFGAQRPDHNLQRARAQLALVAHLELRSDELRRVLGQH